MREELSGSRERAAESAARRRMAGAALAGLAILGAWLLRAAGVW